MWVLMEIPRLRSSPTCEPVVKVAACASFETGAETRVLQPALTMVIGVAFMRENVRSIQINEILFEITSYSSAAR